MAYFIGLLTVVLVLNCAVLTLLVLIQLPKKEAGAGLAFGGAASDALFGAGSGNMLTKITKWAAIIFFVLSLGLGILQSSSFGKHTVTDLQREMEKAAKQSSSQTTPLPTAETPSPAAVPAVTNLLKSPAATNLLTPPAAATPAATNSSPQ